MATASIFKNYVQLVEDKALIVITNDIKGGKYKEPVEVIRKLIAEGQEKEADKLKKQLLGFTPSGTFANGRKAELLTQYSGYVILDLDKLNPSDLEKAKSIASSITHTFAAFVSPSGNGLKIIVAVNSTAEHHNLAFQQVSDYYENQLQLNLDPSGKDVSRLCFMSYDPDCYRNINAEPFNVNIEIIQSKVEETNIKQMPENTEMDKKINIENTDWQIVFGRCIDFTDRKQTYLEGSRNNYIHLLACNCNRSGIPENLAIEYITQNFDLDTKEVHNTIQSVYKNNLAEHAKYANSTTETDIPKSKDELLMNMPFLPDDVFEKLPNILKIGSEAFKDRRERDVFFTGALSILSGCARNVVGPYRAKEHYANLFVFIIAPAASGKGSMTFAKILGDKYHDRLVEESNAKLKLYKIELQQYKAKLADKNIDISELEPPDEPPFKVLFIPANNSSSRVIQHLKEGDENGIFCETEADTMGNVFKQDWGSYSDLLRKSFHHEPISFSRKTNKEWIEIKKPRLSVALAGTPGQVENLIKTAEDGLFSRFIFYNFKSEIAWVRANDTFDGINYTEHFEYLSDQVFKFVDFLETTEKIKFCLTTEQWDKLNDFGEYCLFELATFVSEDLSSTSKRLGLIVFRVAMVLTSLRYFDNGEIADEFLCSDEDFEIALALVRVYQEHAVYMFKELPKQSSVTDKLLKQFFDILPIQFRRKEAIDIANKELNIKERTADLYLSKLTANLWLEKTKTGIYKKLKT
jgi:hypothetical protein